VTCLCVPEEVPDIPGMEVQLGGRPDIGMLVRRMMGIVGAGDQLQEEGEEREKDVENGCTGGANLDGRLGMCASGPASLTREVANAVAGFAGTRAGGRIGLHTEVFAL